jgi:hypothetical protein
MKQFKQAEDYLSLAKWAVVKTPECTHEIKAQLYRNFGQLYAAQNNHRDALAHLSESVHVFLALFMKSVVFPVVVVWSRTHQRIRRLFSIGAGV